MKTLIQKMIKTLLIKIIYQMKNKNNININNFINNNSIYI